MTNHALPQLREMKLKEAAKKVRDGVEETLTYCRFPYEHRTLTRTNNMIERPNPESAAAPGWRVLSSMAILPSYCTAPGSAMWPELSGA